jgi:hypothetical protein
LGKPRPSSARSGAAVTADLFDSGVAAPNKIAERSARGTPDQSVEHVYADTVNLYAYGREIRPNATLVETPSKAQNSRLVSVTTTMNLCDSVAGTSL